jgi:hypothetical protein
VDPICKDPQYVKIHISVVVTVQKKKPPREQAACLVRASARRLVSSTSAKLPVGHFAEHAGKVSALIGSHGEIGQGCTESLQLVWITAQ